MTEQDPGRHPGRDPGDERPPAAGRPDADQPQPPVQPPPAQQPPPPPPYGPPPYGPQAGPVPYPQQPPGAPYPPQLYPQGPPGKPPPDSAMWAHLAALLIFTAGTGACCIGFLLGWIGPLNIRNKAKDPFVRHHGTQGLNWGITQPVVVAIAAALMGGTIYLVEEQGWPEWVPAVPMIACGAYLLASLVFAIIGCNRAKNGVLWSYPRLFAFPFAKP